MAENKKSFVLYCDLIHTIEKLPSEKAGELFKHILRYVNDTNPTTEDIIVEIAFEPIKQQLKRDLREWEQERINRSEAGKKGMEKRWHNKDNTTITKHNTVIQPITNITDNVTVTVNDTVNDTTNTHETFAKRLLENQLEKESIEMTVRETVTTSILKQFNAHLINESKQHPHYSEYKKHLCRWMPKRFKSVEPQRRKIQQL